jgi:uncharacterized protein YbcV (DUF1398 family)
MFTIQQIQTAHSKVQSGADFPKYIKEIKQLGILSYETYVTDGQTVYFGLDEYKLSSSAKYESLPIASTVAVEAFKNDLKAHQQGQTDYPTFCRDCAKSGIEKWMISTEKMTCSYYDLQGNEVLIELIPQ